MSHDRTCPTCRPGTVNFYRHGGDPEFVKALQLAEPLDVEWMRDHFDRVRLNSPFGDPFVPALGPAWFYRDMYAIYVGQEIAARHPEWILRDDKGEPLYIPYKSAGAAGYSQFAGDITNPAFRAYWIAAARETLAQGYVGVMIDDVNYYRRVGTAAGYEKGVQVGAAGVLDDAIWRRAVKDFMWQVRAELDCEIAHNVVWSVNAAAAADAAYGYPAADWLLIERGVNDASINGGTGQWSLRTMLAWIDARHVAGQAVIFDSLAVGDAAREYALACYYLVSNGRDMLGSREGGMPADWWAPYGTVLGQPRGPRVRLTDSGLMQRQFEHGFVVVNEPRAKPFTLADGRVLGPASGAVVVS